MSCVFVYSSLRFVWTLGVKVSRSVHASLKLIVPVAVVLISSGKFWRNALRL